MTDPDDRPQLSQAEAKAALAALFPHGWGGPDVLAELAPGGWAACPLVHVYHPSVEQQFDEAVRMHQNLATLPFRKPDAPPPPPAPTRDEIAAQHQETPVDPVRECQELVGLCLWDVFSDNHEVTAADGRLVELGSHRAAGGFLAELLNAQGGPPPLPRPDMTELFDQMFPKPPGSDPTVSAFMAEMRKEMVGDGGYTYLDFYMGSRSVADRADLQPVYELIFRRLRAAGMDWKYTFPRLYAVDLRPLKKMLDEQDKETDEPEWSGYDPSAAFEEEAEEREQDEKLADLREQLDDGHREAVAAAREQEPPTVVRAYRAVYGELPAGWPPTAE